jgi:hypothetical protein
VPEEDHEEELAARESFFVPLDEFLAEVHQRRSIPQSHRRGDLTDRGFGA